MSLVELKERFFQLVAPPLPNDWEVEENLEALRPLPRHRQELVLRQIPAIWPVSNSLCYSYLAKAGTALECLADQQISAWVSAILDTYEQEGLRAAQDFMADAETNFLCRLRGENGVELASLPYLQTYAQGMAGQPLRLAPGLEPGTDTETIFLPAQLNLFATQEENSLYYKLLLTIQAGLLQIGTYHLEFGRAEPPVQSLLRAYPPRLLPPEIIHLGDYFQLFPEPRLAEDLFTLVEARRLLGWLAANFPGLWRDGLPLLQQLSAAELHPSSGSLDHGLNWLRRLILGSPAPTNLAMEEVEVSFPALSACFLRPAKRVAETAEIAAALYAQFAGRFQAYQPRQPLPWLGRLQPQAALQVRRRQRQQAKDKFIQGLALLLADKHSPAGPEQIEPGPGRPSRSEQNPAAALLLEPERNHVESQSEAQPVFPAQTLVTLETLALELPETLRDLAHQIDQDLGGIPAEYISAAQGVAGQGPPPVTALPESAGESLRQTLTYAEWDFRRQGYRKDWCAVHEKNILPVRSSLIETTLEKYRGQLRQIRHQFELLRAGERFVRRQPDGGDFDLDAVIEALSDRRAGRAGSDQLFIQLRRDQRDIAVLFLVDMSSSTEGWVNLALKESLILTGEALQSIGDRFAIAGFSGMRRSRCEFYRVKEFAEPYNGEVKGRICAIGPREYTRMGPALRHATNLLHKVEARVRLLVVLSDGKPEDYDDYKGKYAIEDTRQALIEAKVAGIHPFCITIDRQAHEYMPHMYGEVNYIFLEDVRQLPRRLPAIYRNLTT